MKEMMVIERIGNDVVLNIFSGTRQNIGIGRDYAFYALPFEQWENLNLPYDHRSVSRIFISDFKTLK